MKNALNRINELQQEIINKSKNIAGARRVCKTKMALYEEDEKLDKWLKNIQLQEKIITEKFLINKRIIGNQLSFTFIFLYSHNFIFYKFNIINSAIASTGKNYSWF